MKKTIKVDLFIEYDEEKKIINNYEIRSYYTLAEIAVIVTTFKNCLEDWGYSVERKKE